MHVCDVRTRTRHSLTPPPL
jgi:hypothetical protein